MLPYLFKHWYVCQSMQPSLICMKNLFSCTILSFLSFYNVKSPFDIWIADFALDQFVLKNPRNYASLMECPVIWQYMDCLLRQHCRCSKSIYNAYSAYKPCNGKWRTIPQDPHNAGFFFEKIDPMQSWQSKPQMEFFTL